MLVLNILGGIFAVAIGLFIEVLIDTAVFLGLYKAITRDSRSYMEILEAALTQWEKDIEEEENNN